MTDIIVHVFSDIPKHH